MSFKDEKNFDSVFMDSIEEAITFSRLTYKDPNNSLHMFAVRTEKVLDDKQSQCMLWMLRNVDFDFEIASGDLLHGFLNFDILLLE